MTHLLRIDWKVFWVILSCAILQMTIVPWVSVGGIAPNLCFLFVAFYAFQLNHHQIFLIAFATGLFRDFLTQSFFGIDTVSLVFGSLVLQQMASRLDRDNFWVQFWGVFLFSFVSLLINLILLSSIQQAWMLNGYQLAKAFLITVYTTLGAFLAFPFLKRLFNVSALAKQYELF